VKLWWLQICVQCEETSVEGVDNEKLGNANRREAVIGGAFKYSWFETKYCLKVRKKGVVACCERTHCGEDHLFRGLILDPTAVLHLFMAAAYLRRWELVQPVLQEKLSVEIQRTPSKNLPLQSARAL
jgi:hypothetical protein